MKKLLLPLILFSSISYGADCSKHPIFCQIKKNKPKISNKKAMNLSNIIYKMHRKYHVPSRIFTAILMQESGYSLEAKGCYKGIPDTDRLGGVVKVCMDFGISQIYYKTAQSFKFDIDKLTTDLDYSVEAGAKVLADFMNRYEAKDNDWWVRYNCGSRGTTKRDTCQIYKKLVERYL